MGAHDVSDDTLTSQRDAGWRDGGAVRNRMRLALTIVWSRDEPERIGETAFVETDGKTCVLGRGEAALGNDVSRLKFYRQRPGQNELRSPLKSPQLSRVQLELRAEGGQLRIRSVGRCPMILGGLEQAEGVLSVGQALVLRNQLVLLCSKRPLEIPRLSSRSDFEMMAYGRPDKHGLVGESPASWLLRDRLLFIAGRQAHVLVSGPSGVGKELAAKTIHGASRRKSENLVARNAATLPPGLIDAELFGNMKDYPNPGMSERKGLVGQAHGSTLFLDEIGEIPEKFQAHLLRILDGDGEYQRLGESRSRQSDFRLVAATNRSVTELKHDLAARLTLRVEVEGLNERREDIPLLIRHLLTQIAAEDPEIGTRFFEGWTGRDGHPRIDPLVIVALVEHVYTHHVRELERLLWLAMTSSPGNYIAATDALKTEINSPAQLVVDPAQLTPEQIGRVLDAEGGNLERTWRVLGLSSRHVLYRLIKKYGISHGAAKK